METVLELFKLRKRAGEIGIEIECEGMDLPPVPLYWDVTHDGSLRGTSIEYVLKNPAKRKEISKVLNFLKKTWEEQGARIVDSERTSVHIHVNVQEMEMREMISFYCVYNILEELLVKFCGKGRDGNLFCLTSSDANFALDMLCEITQKQEWFKLKDRNFRYGAVNFNSVPKFGSLEFRTMRGTSDIALIKRWIAMLLKIKDFSAQFGQPVHIIEHLSAKGGCHFVEDVMGEYAMFLIGDMKEEDVDEFMRQGVWRIQELAYIPIMEKKRKVRVSRVFKNMEGERIPPPEGPAPRWMGRAADLVLADLEQALEEGPDE